MQFRPALQYGQHASDGEIEHQIGFQVEIVGINPSTEIMVKRPNSFNDETSSGELCGPASKANRSRR